MSTSTKSKNIPFDIQYHILQFVPKSDIPYIAQVNKVVYNRVYEILQMSKMVHTINSSSDVFIKKFHTTITFLRAKYPLITDKQSYMMHHYYICNQFKSYETSDDNMTEWTNNFLNNSKKNTDVLYLYIDALHRRNSDTEVKSMAIFLLCCEYIEVTLLYLSINRENEHTCDIIDLLSCLYMTKYDIINYRKQWFSKYDKMMCIANFISNEFLKINVISSKILDLESNHNINDIMCLMGNIGSFCDVIKIYCPLKEYEKSFSKMECDPIVEFAAYYILIYLEHLHSNALELRSEYVKQTAINSFISNMLDVVLNNDDCKNTLCALFKVPNIKTTDLQIQRYILQNLNNVNICKDCVIYLKKKNEFIEDNACFTFL